MATWHFDCVLMPRDALASIVSIADTRREGTLALWKGVAAAELRAALAVIGAPARTWNAQMGRWGDEDGTCLFLTSTEENVEELRLRIDLRSDASAFVARVGEALRRFDVVALTEQAQVVELSVAALSRAAMHSSVVELVRDGVAALPRLAARVREAEAAASARDEGRESPGMLEAVGEALAQHGRGEVVTARCAACERVLEVVDVVATGALVVRCPDGHVSFRARRSRS